MIVYGRNVARELLSTNKQIHRAYISKTFKDNDLINDLKQQNIKINFVNKEVLDNKTKENHQGIILEIDDVKTYTLDDLLSDAKSKTRPVFVILDHLEDPHNFGAIIRTSEALGVDGIIIPNDRSVGINATVVKTSVGAINYIKIARVANIGATIEKLQKNGFWIFGTDMKGTNYQEQDYSMPVCLIIGNEGKGISPKIKEKCDFMVTIPMKGSINSLNASVSCAIILSKILG